MREDKNNVDIFIHQDWIFVFSCSTLFQKSFNAYIPRERLTHWHTFIKYNHAIFMKVFQLYSNISNEESQCNWSYCINSRIFLHKRYCLKDSFNMKKILLWKSFRIPFLKLYFNLTLLSDDFAMKSRPSQFYSLLHISNFLCFVIIFYMLQIYTCNFLTCDHNLHCSFLLFFYVVVFGAHQNSLFFILTVFIFK